VGGEELHAVLPLGHGALWAWQARPWVMGILNVTPDSFSDGGAYLEVGLSSCDLDCCAIPVALQMIVWCPAAPPPRGLFPWPGISHI
jgi:hypothetical protein